MDTHDSQETQKTGAADPTAEEIVVALRATLTPAIRTYIRHLRDRESLSRLEDAIVGELAKVADGADMQSAIRRITRAVVLNDVAASGLSGTTRLKRFVQGRPGCLTMPDLMRQRAEGNCEVEDLRKLYSHLNVCTDCSLVAARLNTAEWQLGMTLADVPLDPIKLRPAAEASNGLPPTTARDVIERDVSDGRATPPAPPAAPQDAVVDDATSEPPPAERSTTPETPAGRHVTAAEDAASHAPPAASSGARPLPPPLPPESDTAPPRPTPPPSDANEDAPAHGPARAAAEPAGASERPTSAAASPRVKRAVGRPSAPRLAGAGSSPKTRPDQLAPRPDQAPPPAAGGVSRRARMLAAGLFAAVVVVVAVVFATSSSSGGRHARSVLAATGGVLQTHGLRTPFVLPGGRWTAFEAPQQPWTRFATTVNPGPGLRWEPVEIVVKSLAANGVDPRAVQFQLRDSTGRLYSPDPQIGTQPGVLQHTQPLPLGQQAQAQVAFRVPATASALTLIFRPGSNVRVEIPLHFGH